MNAKPSISRKTFLRMPNQIQRGRKSYDTLTATRSPFTDS
jgi:hypothetical protein